MKVFWLATLLAAGSSSGTSVKKDTHAYERGYLERRVCIDVPKERSMQIAKPYDSRESLILDRAMATKFAAYDPYFVSTFNRSFANTFSVVVVSSAGLRDKILKGTDDEVVLAFDRDFRRDGAVVSWYYQRLEKGVWIDAIGRKWFHHNIPTSKAKGRIYYLPLDDDFYVSIGVFFDSLVYDKINFETRAERISRVLSSVRSCKQ